MANLVNFIAGMSKSNDYLNSSIFQSFCFFLHRLNFIAKGNLSRKTLHFKDIYVKYQL